MKSQETVRRELNNIKDKLTEQFSENMTKDLRQQYKALAWVLEPEEEEEEERRRR